MHKYAVFGNPISHSKSPQIHRHFAQQAGLKIECEAICAQLDNFAQTVRKFFEAGGLGANITVPFKIEALKMADELSDKAIESGAVNLLYVNNGKLCGDNVDGQGLLIDLEKNKKIDLLHKNVLILGAGGAARGIIPAFFEENPSVPNLIAVYNRTSSTATKMVNNLKDTWGYYNLELYSKEVLAEYEAETFDLIINATSSSLNKQFLDISHFPFHSQTICYDLAYSNEPTLFLQDAHKLGLTNLFDGWGMLVEQAAISFFNIVGKKYYPHTSYLLANRHLF